MSKRKYSNDTVGIDYVVNTFVEGIKDVESNLEKLRKKIENRPIKQKVVVETADKNTAKKIAGLNKTILSQKKEEAKLSKSALARQRAGRGTRRPFEAMMMGIGSFMLLKYAVQVPFLWASALGDAMANVETESRKGHAYRQSLGARGIGTSAFDTAVARYSELSGEQGYKSRVRMANIYGQLEQRGTSIGSLNPKAIANVLQGFTLGMGLSDEQADKKLIELLTGKISKEDKKTFGIKSRTPVQILEEINSTLLKNPVIASTMTGSSASSDMKFIRGAKSELLSRINDKWPNLFTQITKPMKEFVETFFGLNNKLIESEWTTTLSTIRDNIKKVFTRENAEKLAKFVNRITSALSMLLGSVGEFVFKHPWLTGIVAGIGLYNKSRTGSFLGIGGENGKSDVAKVFVTNHADFFAKNKFTEILGSALASSAGAIGSAMATPILTALGIGAGVYGGYKFIQEVESQNTLEKALPFLQTAGLNFAQIQRYKNMVKEKGYVDPDKYIREVLGEEKFKLYQDKMAKDTKQFYDAVSESAIGKDYRDRIFSDATRNEDMMHKLGFGDFKNPKHIGAFTQNTYNIGVVNVEGKNIRNDQLINDTVGGAY